MATQIQLRRGTSAEWAASTRILAQGEVGIDLTLGEMRLGDGVTAWAGLTPIGAVDPADVDAAVAAYLLANPPAAAPVDSVNGQTGAVILDASDVGADAAGTAAAAVAALDIPAAAYPVQQVALTGNLAYTLPVDAPADQVHQVVFTQPEQEPTGYTVTYGGQPVAVDTAAGASTLVEVWPGGMLVYPGASAPAGASSAITADDTPAAPAEGESASYFVTSAVSWPAGLVWSTDPDGGVAPTITGTALVSMFTVGGVTRAVLGATFPALPGADATPPTVGTMAASAITTSGFTLTVSGASDAVGLHAQPYAFTTDGGTTLSAYQASAVYVASGLTASTGYSCNWRVRDAAGNVSTGTAQTVTTTTAVTALASDDFNRPNSTTGLGVATTGQTWQQIGTGIVGIIDNRAYRATSNAFAVIDVGQVDMKVSHKVVASGDYFSGPIARATADGQDFYWVDTGSGGGAVRIQATIAGTQVSPAGTSSFSTAPGDVLALSCKENGAGGTVVKLFINGVEKQSITDTRSNRPMGTRAGVRPFNNGNIRLDDFLVESA